MSPVAVGSFVVSILSGFSEAVLFSSSFSEEISAFIAGSSVLVSDLPVSFSSLIAVSVLVTVVSAAEMFSFAGAM